ncbi:uncharacterized protein [Acropora muricata]|uniref:uncharacterized protein isoform X2 n=1 Tax=Acropora muricata TaxID=159855 RepID=UPI0034E5A969
MANFCSSCGENLGQYALANYCPKCGTKVHAEFNVTENVAIEKYFHLGYDYKTITDLLLVHHGITMSVRTLKRRLKSNNLGKKKINVDEDLVRNIIRSEMQGPGQLAGYRKMWHILRIKHHVHAPRRLVAQILHELDPDGSKARKRNKLHRRIYQSHGPNQCWHIDGYDKLKPFGFPIHSAVDGYSRKVMWLETCRSNNIPSVPAKLYLQCVQEHKGCPLLVRSDYGTENGIIAGMQCFFRSDNAPFSENSGGTDCLIPVPQEKIDEMKLECQGVEEESIFQEYFEYLMETEGIQYPTRYDEALTLFSYLTTVADV